MRVITSKKSKHTVLATLGVVLAILLGKLSIGCHPLITAEDVQAAYLAELAECVKTAHSRPEADTCRAAVDRKYNVCWDQTGERLVPCAQ